MIRAPLLFVYEASFFIFVTTHQVLSLEIVSNREISIIDAEFKKDVVVVPTHCRVLFLHVGPSHCSCWLYPHYLMGTLVVKDPCVHTGVEVGKRKRFLHNGQQIVI
jgi:hypothetical protein